LIEAAAKCYRGKRRNRRAALKIGLIDTVYEEKLREDEDSGIDAVSYACCSPRINADYGAFDCAVRILMPEMAKLAGTDGITVTSRKCCQSCRRRGADTSIRSLLNRTWRLIRDSLDNPRGDVGPVGVVMTRPDHFFACRDDLARPIVSRCRSAAGGGAFFARPQKTFFEIGQLLRRLRKFGKYLQISWRKNRFRQSDSVYLRTHVHTHPFHRNRQEKHDECRQHQLAWFSTRYADAPVLRPVPTT
jgi:hypothetical protein